MLKVVTEQEIKSMQRYRTGKAANEEVSHREEQGEEEERGS